MLLSHIHRFIYTKTLKTAGTSVEIYLENACIPPGSSIVRGHHIEQTVTPAGVIGYRGSDPTGRTWYNHMPAREIRELTGAAIWNDYFKFCVARNPFDKMVSLWWFINSKQELPYTQRDFSIVRSDFSRWCVSHARCTIDRDKYLIDGQVAVDYFIRYESLADGLESVCRRIGYRYRPELLGKFKSGSRIIRQPFSDYYDQSAIAAVEAAFGWELDYFGYSRLSDALGS